MDIYNDIAESQKLLAMVRAKDGESQTILDEVVAKLKAIGVMICPTIREDLVHQIVEIMSSWESETVFTTIDVYERVKDATYVEVVDIMRTMHSHDFLVEEKQLIMIPPREVDGAIVEQVWQYKICRTG